MEAVAPSRFIVIFSASEKKDLLKELDDKTREYWEKKMSGSITLHYNQGFFAKLEHTGFSS